MYSVRKIIFILLFFNSLNLISQNQLCDFKQDILRIRKQLLNYFQKFDYLSYPSLNQKLLLFWLNKKYQLKLPLPKDFLNMKLVYAEDSLVKKYYLRLIEPKFSCNIKELQQDYNKTQDIEHLLLWSIYPNILPFDKECETTVFEPNTNDSYSVRRICHLLIAYHWAYNHSQYKIPDSISVHFEVHSPYWKQNILDYLRYDKGYSDTAIEGMLALSFMNQLHDLPMQSFLEFLFFPSNDGGYPWDKDYQKSNFHASLVALWFICEVIDYCN